MRFHLIGACVIGFVAFANAQAPSTRDLNLRGDRFKPLTYEQLTPAQKTMADNLLSGERGTLNGPFNVLLRSPELGDLVQKVGAHVRFHSSLSPRLNEMAILMTGRYWTSQYEWYAHKTLALKAGLGPAIVTAIAEGRRPAAMPPEEQAVYNFASELLNTKQVSDAAFKALVDRFGERGAVDLTGTISYYQFVS